MILYPAIDLKDGQCVRVLHGDLDTATVFNNSPAAQAASFVEAGFHWVHVVDLNGAVQGKAVNEKAVEAILEAVSAVRTGQPNYSSSKADEFRVLRRGRGSRA